MTEKPLVFVRWKDARSDDGWCEQQGLEIRLAEITTVGHLICETDDVLCVASSFDAHTGQVSGIMFIPQVCVAVLAILEQTIEKDSPQENPDAGRRQSEPLGGGG